MNAWSNWFCIAATAIALSACAMPAKVTKRDPAFVGEVKAIAVSILVDPSPANPLRKHNDMLGRAGWVRGEAVEIFAERLVKTFEHNGIDAYVMFTGERTLQFGVPLESPATAYALLIQPKGIEAFSRDKKTWSASRIYLHAALIPPNQGRSVWEAEFDQVFTSMVATASDRFSLSLLTSLADAKLVKAPPRGFETFEGKAAPMAGKSDWDPVLGKPRPAAR